MWIVVTIVVVLIVALALSGIFALMTRPPTVDVQVLNVYAPDNVCGLNANPVGYWGFNASAGSQQAMDLQLENFNTSGSCTVRGVTTNTSGFSVSNVQVPDTVGALGNGTLNLTLSLPNSAFSGIVNLVFS